MVEVNTNLMLRVASLSGAKSRERWTWRGPIRNGRDLEDTAGTQGTYCTNEGERELSWISGRVLSCLMLSILLVHTLFPPYNFSCFHLLFFGSIFSLLLSSSCFSQAVFCLIPSFAPRVDEREEATSFA